MKDIGVILWINIHIQNILETLIINSLKLFFLRSYHYYRVSTIVLYTSLFLTVHKYILKCNLNKFQFCFTKKEKLILKNQVQNSQNSRFIPSSIILLNEHSTNFSLTSSLNAYRPAQFLTSLEKIFHAVGQLTQKLTTGQRQRVTEPAECGALLQHVNKSSTKIKLQHHHRGEDGKIISARDQGGPLGRSTLWT